MARLHKEMGRRAFEAGVVAAFCIAGSPALAASLPTGAWSCSQDAGSKGPAAGQDKGSDAGKALVEQLWIVDGEHYALSSADRPTYGAAAKGRYVLKGDRLVGLSGPLDQTPMVARVMRSGSDTPAIELSWSSAPGLVMSCRPGA